MLCDYKNIAAASDYFGTLGMVSKRGEMSDKGHPLSIHRYVGVNSIGLFRTKKIVKK